MIKYDRYTGGKRYAATFSYDDGGAADRRLVELFNKYGAKCTFNLISSSLIKTEGTGIKAAELKELYSGHEIACHTYSHPHLERMSVQDQYEELIRDRQIIEDATGRIIRGLAYPFGTYSPDTTFAAMKTASLVYGRTATATNSFELPSDFRIWNPTTHHNECEPYVKKFLYNVEKAIWRAAACFIYGDTVTSLTIRTTLFSGNSSKAFSPRLRMTQTGSGSPQILKFTIMSMPLKRFAAQQTERPSITPQISISGSRLTSSRLKYRKYQR